MRVTVDGTRHEGVVRIEPGSLLFKTHRALRKYPHASLVGVVLDTPHRVRGAASMIIPSDRQRCVFFRVECVRAVVGVVGRIAAYLETDAADVRRVIRSMERSRPARPRAAASDARVASADAACECGAPERDIVLDARSSDRTCTRCGVVVSDRAMRPCGYVRRPRGASVDLQQHGPARDCIMSEGHNMSTRIAATAGGSYLHRASRLCEDSRDGSRRTSVGYKDRDKMSVGDTMREIADRFNVTDAQAAAAMRMYGEYRDRWRNVRDRNATIVACFERTLDARKERADHVCAERWQVLVGTRGGEDQWRRAALVRATRDSACVEHDGQRYVATFTRKRKRATGRASDTCRVDGRRRVRVEVHSAHRVRLTVDGRPTVVDPGDRVTLRVGAATTHVHVAVLRGGEPTVMPAVPVGAVARGTPEIRAWSPRVRRLSGCGRRFSSAMDLRHHACARTTGRPGRSTRRQLRMFKK